jgi:hypothetical protein
MAVLLILEVILPTTEDNTEVSLKGNFYSIFSILSSPFNSLMILFIILAVRVSCPPSLPKDFIKALPTILYISVLSPVFKKTFKALISCSRVYNTILPRSS